MGLQLLLWRDEDDKLKSAVAKAPRFESMLNAAFTVFADHCDTTIRGLPDRQQQETYSSAIGGKTSFADDE
jgi:hypothetical protein